MMMAMTMMMTDERSKTNLLNVSIKRDPILLHSLRITAM